MRFLEYEGKQLLTRIGLPIPRGGVARTPGEAERVARKLSGAVVVKAQVPVGGRGKEGGILPAATPEEAARRAGAILGRPIRGFPVGSVLVEERVTAEAELYLGVVLDEANAKLVVLLSTRGGVEVEAHTRDDPASLISYPLDPLAPFPVHAARELARRAGLKGRMLLSVADALSCLAAGAAALDLVLAEVNPLFASSDGRMLVGDARLEMDDAAVPRQQAALLEIKTLIGEQPIQVSRAEGAQIAYVPLDGDIGILAGGAGLALATMDLVCEHGGRSANFLDFGGGGSAALIAQALRRVLEQDGVRGVILNAYGGINNCQAIAEGVVAALGGRPPEIPVVIKMRGHFQEQAWALLEGHGIPIIKRGSTGDAVRLLLRLVGENVTS